MSDPIEFLWSSVQDLKAGAHKVLGQVSDRLNNGLESVSSTDTYQYLEKMLKTGKATTEVLLRPAPPPPPPTMYDRLVDWVARNKWFVLVAAGASTGAIYYYWAYLPATAVPRKRRARKTAEGARTQVVILAGSPSEPITRLVANDLDKRGFIVYWTVTSNEERQMVLRQNSADLRPLSIQKASGEATSIEEACTEFQTTVLDPDVVPFPGAPPHKLVFAGVILVPDLYFETGPVEAIRPDTWSDLVYSKILGPIFMLSNGFLELVRANAGARIVLMTPSIMANLSPGFHAPESVSISALNTLALCLYRELKPAHIDLVQLQLGSFDVVNHRSSQDRRTNLLNMERQVFNSMRADVLSWPERVRYRYASMYQASAHLQIARGTGSSPLRTLNHAVFDALTAPNPRRVYFVGTGSYAYHWLSRLVPECIMTWLLQPSMDRRDQDWEFVGSEV